MNIIRLKQIILSAQFAALIAISTFIYLPLGPVPFTLQTMFILLAGLYLGKLGIIAVALYILAGCLGLPIFSGGKAGIGVLLGPTGGYLVGFLGAAWVASYAQVGTMTKQALILGLALLVLHGFGILGLMNNLKLGLIQAVSMNIPFMLIDLVKAGVALTIWRYKCSR